MKRRIFASDRALARLPGATSDAIPRPDADLARLDRDDVLRFQATSAGLWGDPGDIPREGKREDYRERRYEPTRDPIDLLEDCRLAQSTRDNDERIRQRAIAADTIRATKRGMTLDEWYQWMADMSSDKVGDVLKHIAP